MHKSVKSAQSEISSPRSPVLLYTPVRCRMFAGATVDVADSAGAIAWDTIQGVSTLIFLYFLNLFLLFPLFFFCAFLICFFSLFVLLPWFGKNAPGPSYIPLDALSWGLDRELTSKDGGKFQCPTRCGSHSPQTTCRVAEWGLRCSSCLPASVFPFQMSIFVF